MLEVPLPIGVIIGFPGQPSQLLIQVAAGHRSASAAVCGRLLSLVLSRDNIRLQLRGGLVEG
ncbi:hypothetical protein D3C81_2159300 [compost metagenome]